MKLIIKLIPFLLISILIMVSCKKDTPEAGPLPGSILISNVSSWNFASVPLHFSESNLNNDIAYGFNRARICWYTIDPSVFYDKSHNLRPPNISIDDMSADDCRIIYENELFPSKENQYTQPLYLYVFNIDYYPFERGPWNFDTNPSAYSAGIANNGSLKDPTSRWAGITRKVESTDRAIKYLDFWLLDPFTTYPDAEGELVFDMGEISEDVLKDGLIASENTIEGQTISTVWGLIKPLSDYFSFPPDNDRKKYDTGLDELQSNNENIYLEDESSYFKDYLNTINAICDPTAFNSISADPSNDDFHSFLGKDLDQLNSKVRERYKRINENENNSPLFIDNQSNTIGYRNPNNEDIDNNRILDTLNNYREYRIKIKPESFQPGSNYVVDIYTSSHVSLENGKITSSKFYHFLVPLKDYTKTYGNPDLSANPKFIRLYFRGFTSPINLRFINFMFTEDIFEYTH